MGAHLSRTVAEGRAFMQLIDGKPVDALSGERIDVICPSDGKAFASIPACGKADITATMRYYEFYGGAGDKIHGDTIPFLPGYMALTLREPHGVVAGIIRRLQEIRRRPRKRVSRRSTT